MKIENMFWWLASAIVLIPLGGIMIQVYTEKRPTYDPECIAKHITVQSSDVHYAAVKLICTK